MASLYLSQDSPINKVCPHDVDLFRAPSRTLEPNCLVVDIATYKHVQASFLNAEEACTITQLKVNRVNIWILPREDVGSCVCGRRHKVSGDGNIF